MIGILAYGGLVVVLTAWLMFLIVAACGAGVTDTEGGER